MTSEERSILWRAGAYIGIVILIGLHVSMASAATVTITWTHDQTTCSDGSTVTSDCPTTDFEIFQGSTETATDYVRVASAISSAARSHALLNVRPGRKCFYVSATSPAGPSESNRVCSSVPFLPPKSPFITSAIAITTVTP